MVVLIAGTAPTALGQTGMAIWRTMGSPIPNYSALDGATFGPATNTDSMGTWRILAGAQSPTRNEALVLGVDSSRHIAGEMWDGVAWTALAFNNLATVGQSNWWGFAVAYGESSGDGYLVYNNGGTGSQGVSWRSWDGDAWSGPDTITTPLSGEPRQMCLAVKPKSDEMVLVISNASSQDYALVFDGSTWGHAQVLDASGSGDDRTDVYAAYEQQSGHAMVVYGKGTKNAYSRIWNGTAWSGEDSAQAPGGVSGDIRWTTLGSDPATNRIALGVTTRSDHTWLSLWNGTSWATATIATSSLPSQTVPNVAVGFEGSSGEALAVYGESVSTFRYRTWKSDSGWSAELTGPSIGSTPNSLMLDAHADSNLLMLSIQNVSRDLNCVRWNGDAWGSPTQLETNTPELKNQPFLFLWFHTVLSVSVTRSDFSFGMVAPDSWLTPQSSVIRNTGTVVETFVGQISPFTDGSNTWQVSTSANGADSIRAQWSTVSDTGPWSSIPNYDTDFTIAADVAFGDSVTFWLRIETPTSTTSFDQHASALTVTAQ